MARSSKKLAQEKLGFHLCQLLLDHGSSASAENAVRLAAPDTLRAVLAHIVKTGDGDKLISDLIDLPAEGRAIRAILKLAIHLIECHKPE